MIIECINCHKKFKVDSKLIPENGRQIQCGSCNHIWHFKYEKPIVTTTKKNEQIVPIEEDKIQVLVPLMYQKNFPSPLKDF